MDIRLIMCPFCLKQFKISLNEDVGILHFLECGILFALKNRIKLPFENEIISHIGEYSRSNILLRLAKYKNVHGFFEYGDFVSVLKDWINCRIVSRVLENGGCENDYELIFRICRDLCCLGENIDIQRHFGVSFLPSCFEAKSILGFITQDVGCEDVYSIGCGRGVLEFALTKFDENDDLTITGIEVDAPKFPMLNNIVILKKDVICEIEKKSVVVFCCTAGGDQNMGGTKYIDICIENSNVLGIVIIDDSSMDFQGSCKPNFFEIRKRVDFNRVFQILHPIQVTSNFCVAKNIWFWKRKF